MPRVESEIINYYKQIADMMSGKQKDFWEWKLKNAQLLTYVKTDDIRKQYPQIDEYLKNNPHNVNQKECFKNAGQLCIEVEGVDYVEGEILYHGIPLEHAWNKIDGKYFDITKDILFPKNSDYSEYVKIIELDIIEYTRFMFKYKHWGGFVREQYIRENGLKESYFPRLFENSRLMSRYYRDKFGVMTNKTFHYADEDKEDVVARVNGSPIIKNPKTLESFDTGVRAIVDKRANLYVAKDNGTFNHGMMANALMNAGEIKTIWYNENATSFRDFAGIYDDQKNFILLLRLHTKDMFFQSDTFEWQGEETEKLIQKLKDRFPQYKFHFKDNYDE